MNNMNYTYHIRIREEDEDKIPIMGKETLEECKRITEKYSGVKTVIGVPFLDGEYFSFCVPEDEFKKIESDLLYIFGEYDWKEASKSCVYKNLYKTSAVPDVPIWSKKYENPTHLLKVKYNDYGIVSIEETDIPVERLY